MPITQMRKSTPRADPRPRRSALSAAIGGDTVTELPTHRSAGSKAGRSALRVAGILSVRAWGGAGS
ncbi:hypothetical protein GCM10009860_13620 [Microbacterium mitrae]